MGGGTKQVQRNLRHSLFQLLIIAVGAEEQKICTKGALLLRLYSDDGDLGNERLKLLKKGCVCVCDYLSGLSCILSLLPVSRIYPLHFLFFPLF